MPVSPNGELLGLPTPDEAAYRRVMLGWFQRADADRDGALDLMELETDAASRFAAYDLNRDGSVTSSELTRVRVASPYRPPPERPTARLRRRGGPTVSSEQVEATPAEERREQGGRDHRVRVAFDPVMSADTDADFRVSPSELAAQAGRKFRSHDTDGDGRLTPAEFLEGQLAPLRALRGG